MKLIEHTTCLSEITGVMGTPDIKVITGVRRSGKSKLMEAFFGEILASDPGANVVHVNLDLTEFEGLPYWANMSDTSAIISQARSAGPAARAISAFRLLGRASAPRGMGTLACMKSQLTPLGRQTFPLPVWMP